MKKLLLAATLISTAALGASAADGFYTKGTKLYDAKDNEFIMRGVNYAWVWQQGNENSVIPAAKQIGCNTVRLAVRFNDGRRADASKLRSLIKLCRDNKLHNIMFSTHIYDDAGKDEGTTRQSIDYTLAPGVPAVIGEFAYKHKGRNVCYQTVMDYCQQKGIGYLVWSWTGNSSEVADCDMFADYTANNYKQNGILTVKGKNGIQATSKELSVFNSTPSGDNPGGNTGDNTGDIVSIFAARGMILKGQNATLTKAELISNGSDTPDNTNEIGSWAPESSIDFNGWNNEIIRPLLSLSIEAQINLL